MADAIDAVKSSDDDEFVETIRKRYAHYGPTEKLNKNTSVYHIRKLLEEIKRLES